MSKPIEYTEDVVAKYRAHLEDPKNRVDTPEYGDRGRITQETSLLMLPILQLVVDERAKGTDFREIILAVAGTVAGECVNITAMATNTEGEMLEALDRLPGIVDEVIRGTRNEYMKAKIGHALGLELGEMGVDGIAVKIKEKADG